MKKLTTTIPPKKGPQSQGLNVPLKQVKLINSGKKYGNKIKKI